MEETANTFDVGDVVSGLEPGDLVRITKISPLGAKVLLEGITLAEQRLVQRPVSLEQLAELVKVRGETPTFTGDPELFLLGAEAERIRIAHQFDPLFAVNSSIVDPLPHQVEAVYRYLLPLPRIRFLLADDTGAGKTIMTGLLIKELLFRGVLQKVLIITPGGLTKQWKEELEEKFAIYSRLVNRASFDADPAQFSRYEDGLFVTSIDFLSRNEGVLKAASSVQWDLIVVDEAHKLSAYEYGSKTDERARYKAVKELEQNTDHLLFLTATPHRGRKDTFRRLLLLLDRDLFQKDEHVAERIRGDAAPVHAMPAGPWESFEGEKPISKARNRFFLRRLKEEMVDWNNQPLFKERHTKTVGYELTAEEKLLYDRVTAYVRSRRKEAKAKKNRNVELTLMVMQRRLASSIYAITRTLQNRLAALNEVLEILKDTSYSEAAKKRILRGGVDSDDPGGISEYENLTEEEREVVDKKIFRQVLTDDPEKIEKERDEIEELLRLAESLKNHKEAKFVELLSVLDSSDVIRSDKEKLLIFTEHKDTLNNLTQRLEEKGYTVTTIHGGMDVDARKLAQRQFRTKAKLMIATDAAGEGINLQFCRYLINWDIPWNPNRLEQRMGRIHRYGQQDDVWVYNLVARNTREGAVLERILSKMDIMREQMGSDRVYDVIDEWLEDVPLMKLIEDAIDAEDETTTERNTEEALSRTSDQKAEELIALQKKTSLASPLDLRQAQELRDASDEKRLQPMFVQRFFEKAWAACGGTLTTTEEPTVWRLGPTPPDLLDLARKNRHTLSAHFETPFVFDKQLISVASKAEIPEYTKLLGPGHRLFDTLIDWAIEYSREDFAKGAVLVDPNIVKPHNLWLIRSTIDDSRREFRNDTRKFSVNERLVVVLKDHLGFRSTSSSYLLNCTGADGPTLPDLPQHAPEELQSWAYEAISEKQLEQVRKTREEECNLRREYLNTAFTDLILELQDELNEIHQADLFGEDDPEERKRLEDRIRVLKQRKEERLKELDLMLKLNANLPEILAEAVVIPASIATLEEEQTPSKGTPMRRDDEVEAIAMDITMRYEKGRGWEPMDVSQDGEHYDIRSESPTGERRFIEVKGRAQTGAIILTGPELDKLRQLAERAWLYIVTFCKEEKPKLHIIQDPASKLHPEMLYRQVQYFVKEEDWGRYGNEQRV